MGGIDKLRALFQADGESAPESKPDGTSAIGLAAIWILSTINKMSTAKWQSKFSFTFEPGGEVKAGKVGIVDAVFRFGKHRFASLKWVAINKGGYLDWLLNNAGMFSQDGDMMDLIRAAKAWGEMNRDEKPGCFGDKQVDVWEGCKGCKFYTACLSDYPSQLYEFAVQEAKAMFKETGDIRRDVLEINITNMAKRKIKGRDVDTDDPLFEQIVSEAVEYASQQKGGGKR